MRHKFRREREEARHSCNSLGRGRVITDWDKNTKVHKREIKQDTARTKTTTQTHNLRDEHYGHQRWTLSELNLKRVVGG